MRLFTKIIKFGIIYFFQKAGVNNNKTVNSSRRPTSIKKDKNHLPKAGTIEKPPEGPVSPSPGPTLLIHVIVEPIDVLKSSPSDTSIRILRIVSIKYTNMKASTLLTRSNEIGCLLILTGKIALG